jgi:glutaredoxin|tara:strand:- start:54 stop:362 length:309 start_codon:yes stop_codon:yes gene_type:complete
MKDYYIVYTKDGCPYCDKAIGTLREKNEPFMVGDLTHNSELLDAIKQQNEMTTVPIVQYVVHKEVPWNDQPMPHPMLVGGSDDLVKHFKEPEPPEEEQGEEG